MNSDTAQAASLAILRANASLDAALAALKSSVAEEEFAEHRKRFGTAMAALLDIANEIYRQHPELKPVQMGGPYVLPKDWSA